MVKVLSDSTCDLSEELKKRYQIDIIPLHVVMGENEFEDGVNITPDEIYSWADHNKTTPKTSAPAIDRAKEIMEPFLNQGMEIVCFTIATGMSTCYNVIKLAAEELSAEDRVFVIDSANLSTGIGLQVLEAAEMAERGMNGAEITAKIEKIIPRVRASFVVDTLVYLHRGGRCSGLSALVGGVLKLHPRIDVVDGVMGAGKKYRGSMKNAMTAYVKDMEESLLHAKKQRVFITHSGADPETVSGIYDYLAGLHHFNEICITKAGGVISSHCGPGTLGVLFIDGEE